MLSDSEPLQVLFVCGRLSALPTFADWACVAGVAALFPSLFWIPHAVKSWATAFSFYLWKLSINLCAAVLFCAVSYNKKAFPFLPCQREQLGQRGCQERIPVRTFSVNSCNTHKSAQLGAKPLSLPAWCSFSWLPHALLSCSWWGPAGYILFFLFFVSE